MATSGKAEPYRHVRRQAAGLVSKASSHDRQKTRDAIMIFGYRGGGQVRGVNEDKKEPKFSSLGCVAQRTWLRQDRVSTGADNRSDYEKRDR